MSEIPWGLPEEVHREPEIHLDSEVHREPEFHLGHGLYHHREPKAHSCNDQTLAEMLVDVPDEILPILDKIMTLFDQEIQPLLAEILRILPQDILLATVRSKLDSKLRIIEWINKASGGGNIKHVLADFPDEILPILDKIIRLCDQGVQPLVAEILRIVPQDILLAIMRSKPDSKLRIIECIDKASGNIKHVRYASWIKRKLIPGWLEGVDWSIIMGVVANQRDHDICWAVVVVELIRALILIERPETDPNIRLSCQDLIDFTNPELRRTSRKVGHYCYPSTINRGMQYVMKNGVQREEDRPYRGCPPDFPDRAISQFGFIRDFKRLDTIEEVFLQLKYQPIGAAVAMFFPEYQDIGEKIYRGPVLQKSKLVGLHAVSLVAAGEENGERYIRARSSHGGKFGIKGHLKISIDLMLVYVPTPGEEADTYAEHYFSKPSLLLRRFSYPRLLARDEEEIKRKMHRIR